MKKKTLQALITLSTRSTGTKLDSSNILETVNCLPSGNPIDIKENAKQYATLQLESTYGIRTVQPMSKAEIKSTQQIINKINEIKRTKPIRLATIIERIAQKINYEELEEAREFLQTLNKKEIKQLRFTLDVLQKVVDEKVESEQELFQNHTLKAAYSLIQELKKTKKIDQL